MPHLRDVQNFFSVRAKARLSYRVSMASGKADVELTSCSLWVMMEKAREFCLPIYTCFKELKKAYGKEMKLRLDG